MGPQATRCTQTDVFILQRPSWMSPVENICIIPPVRVESTAPSVYLLYIILATCVAQSLHELHPVGVMQAAIASQTCIIDHCILNQL